MEWAFIWVACGIIAGIVANKKGEGCLGVIIGLLLGPLGALIAIASSGNRVECPHCKEMIHKAATVCPHCRREPAAAAPREAGPSGEI